MAPMPRQFCVTWSVGCVGQGPVDNPNYSSRWEEGNEQRPVWLVPPDSQLHPRPVGEHRDPPGAAAI